MCPGLLPPGYLCGALPSPGWTQEPWGWEGGQGEVLEGEEGKGKVGKVGDDQGELRHGRLLGADVPLGPREELQAVSRCRGVLGAGACGRPAPAVLSV